MKKIDLEELRTCDVCGVPMIDGYCFDAGYKYACNDEHRDKIALEEYGQTWEDIYTDEGDSYYTEWYDEWDDEEIEEICEIIENYIAKKSE
jgi:hypothetical protein